MIWTYCFCLVAGGVLIALSLDNDGGGFDGDGMGGSLSLLFRPRSGRLASVGLGCADF